MSFQQEYFKLCPENFRDEDVYVCESRYSAKTKSFKKIKLWTMPISSVRFVPRDVHLPVVRVASVFANTDKIDEEKHTETLEENKVGDSVLSLEKVKKLKWLTVKMKLFGGNALTFVFIIRYVVIKSFN